MKKTLLNHLMKPYSQVLALLLLAFAFSACIFESDEDGLGSWLSDQGMPSSYKVQTLNIENIKAASANLFLDTFPQAADGRATLGHVANLTHDLVLDFGFSPNHVDSAFLDKFNKADTSGATLILYWQRDFYKSKWFPKDSLPLKDEFDVSVSWKLDKGSRSKFLDSIQDIPDSVWYKEVAAWKPSASADTVFKVKMDLSKGDTAVLLPLPSALVKDLKKIKKHARLQLRLSAPKALREYRFWGSASDYPSVLALYTSENEYVAPSFRTANVVKSEEECPECLILHAGVVDSLVVEIPPEPILKALSDFYGDEFPYVDGNDVRQTVIHAQVTMPRDDALGQNELGLPIQVVVGSYVDSADQVVRRMEEYRRDTATIKVDGYQNLVFHDGDSLTLQLTNGFRDFLNKAADGRNMKFMMRLGYPFLQEKLPYYKDTVLTTKKKVVTAKGDTTVEVKKDTVYKFLGHFDYARYDFSSILEKPMSLKLWLASKRGDE